MEFLILAVLLGFIPAFIAKSKGREFFIWYIYGVLIFIVALIHSLLLKKNDNALIEEGMVKCPYCAEFVKGKAKICRYCNKELTPIITATNCQFCKHPVNSNVKRCPNCSSNLTPLSG